jgi:cell division protein FtsZ
MVIVGTVIDDTMEDRLRVTMIATGLGSAAGAKRPPKMEVVQQVIARTGTDNVGVPMRDAVDYANLDLPTVVRSGRARAASPNLATFDASEIPAFLRKQAD